VIVKQLANIIRQPTARIANVQLFGVFMLFVKFKWVNFHFKLLSNNFVIPPDIRKYISETLALISCLTFTTASTFVIATSACVQTCTFVTAQVNLHYNVLSAVCIHAACNAAEYITVIAHKVEACSPHPPPAIIAQTCLHAS
jgi:hypothetical protein